MKVALPAPLSSSLSPKGLNSPAGAHTHQICGRLSTTMPLTALTVLQAPHSPHGHQAIVARSGEGWRGTRCRTTPRSLYLHGSLSPSESGVESDDDHDLVPIGVRVAPSPLPGNWSNQSQTCNRILHHHSWYPVSRWCPVPPCLRAPRFQFPHPPPASNHPPTTPAASCCYPPASLRHICLPFATC